MLYAGVRFIKGGIELKKVILKTLEVVIESALATMGATYLIAEMDWRIVLSAAVMAGAMAFLVGIKGLIKEKKEDRA